MTSSIDSRFEIEVLEPLLLMSASSIDCDAADLAADSGFEAFSAANLLDSAADNTADVLTSVVQEGDSARFWGARSDYTIEDQGFGIVAVKSAGTVDFVADVREIQFADGSFEIGALLTEARASAAATVAPVEAAEPDEALVRVYVAPLELPEESTETEATLQNTSAPEGSNESPAPLDGPPPVVEDLNALLEAPPEIEPPPGSIEFLQSEDEPIRFVDPPPKLANEWPIEFALEFIEPDTSAPQSSTIISDNPPVIFVDTPPLFAEDLALEFIPEFEPESPSTDSENAPLILLPFPAEAESTAATERDWAAELERADDDGPLTEDTWFDNQTADPIAQSLITVTTSDLTAPIVLPVEIFNDCPVMPLVEDGPINGSTEFYQDGNYTYTPDPGFSGQDTFTYEANDGDDGTDIATVTITVETTGTIVTGHVPINDGQSTAITTAEYKPVFHERDAWLNIQLDAVDRFPESIAPQGLWALTVDEDETLFKRHQVANGFSTESLLIAGDPSFRFNAEERAGLLQV